MTDKTKQLFIAACQARQQSHSPYSGFAVGAAVETVNGQIISGCNVENGAYGLCICAEQVAITKAVSQGFTDFRQLVVVAHELATPCGACRQIMSEFFDDDTMIYAFDAEDIETQKAWTMSQLLPDRFSFKPNPG